MSIIIWLTVSFLWVAWLGAISRQFPSWLFAGVHHAKFWRKSGWYILSFLSYASWLILYVKLPLRKYEEVLMGILPILFMAIALRGIAYWKAKHQPADEEAPLGSPQKGKWHELQLPFPDERTADLSLLKKRLLLLPEVMPNHPVSLRWQSSESGQRTLYLRFRSLTDEMAGRVKEAVGEMVKSKA